jgi:hypothetical protein
MPSSIRKLSGEIVLLTTADRSPHVPDAVVYLDGIRRAIEVELTSKSKTQTVEIIDHSVQYYDLVEYH